MHLQPPGTEANFILLKCKPLREVHNACACSLGRYVAFRNAASSTGALTACSERLLDRPFGPAKNTSGPEDLTI